MEGCQRRGDDRKMPARVELGEGEDRPVRLRGEDGILGGDLGHEHYGCDRPGDLVQDGCYALPAALGGGCGTDHPLLRGNFSLPGDHCLALLPRYFRSGRLSVELGVLERESVQTLAGRRASA